MVEGRKNRTLKNLIFAWMNQIIMLLMNIAVRAIFVRVLSKEYLGLSGLFGNIIMLLSLTELGVGTAIVYSLYEPLAHKQEDNICSLMWFYQRVYVAIGIIIMVVGAALTPYLHFFIEEMPEIPQIRQIYLLFVINAASSYFFSYKSSLISADQRDYIIKQVKLITTLVMYLFQIGVLYFTKNYILFLWIQIIATIVQNLICMRIANFMYPFLRRKKKTKLSKNMLEEISRNTKSLMYHKLGEVVLSSTDNLIISKFVGLVAVGLYSNYTLIQQALTSILSQIFAAMIASVGNLKITEGKEKRYDIFKKVFFLNAWIYGFCSISFLCLAQDFIHIFFGESFVMELGILFLVVFRFYLEGMRKTTLTFRDAFGLFWYNRYMPVGEVLINLLISFSLAGKYGVKGVLIGTIISMLVMPWWVEPYIVFRYGLMINVKNYWKQCLKYVLLFVFVAIITWKVCSSISIDNLVLRLGVKACLCGVIPNLFYWLFYRKTEEYHYYFNMFQGIKEVMVEKKRIKEIVDWCIAGLVIIAICMAYISRQYYDKIIRYAAVINFIILAMLFCNHINWVERIKNKEKELLLLIVAVVISLINIVFSHSGYGVIFNITNFLLILYLADKVKLDRKLYGAVGLACIVILGIWIGKGDKTFNTNHASMILFSLSGFAITELIFIMEFYKKEVWGKVISFLFMLGIILPLVIKLRARCVVVGIGVFFVVNYLIPKAAWGCKWLYRTCVGILIGGSILFPLWYVWLWKSGVTIDTRVFGKRFFSGRDIVWDQFLTAFYKEPFTGIGSDILTKIPDAAYTEVHNGLLHILVVHGIFIFAIVAYFLGKRLFQIQEKAAESMVVRQCIAVIVAQAAVSVFENYFILAFYNIFILLLFCMGMERIQSEK